jgi:hypothetical protein
MSQDEKDDEWVDLGKSPLGALYGMSNKTVDLLKGLEFIDPSNISRICSEARDNISKSFTDDQLRSVVNEFETIKTDLVQIGDSFYLAKMKCQRFCDIIQPLVRKLLKVTKEAISDLGLDAPDVTREESEEKIKVKIPQEIPVDPKVLSAQQLKECADLLTYEFERNQIWVQIKSQYDALDAILTDLNNLHLRIIKTNARIKHLNQSADIFPSLFCLSLGSSVMVCIQVIASVGVCLGTLWLIPSSAIITLSISKIMRDKILDQGLKESMIEYLSRINGKLIETDNDVIEMDNILSKLRRIISANSIDPSIKAIRRRKSLVSIVRGLIEYEEDCINLDQDLIRLSEICQKRVIG